jgi:dUTP pyrophosphatase
MDHITYEPNPWDTTTPNPSQSNTLIIPANPIPCGEGNTRDYTRDYSLVRWYPGTIVPYDLEPLEFEPLFKVKLLNPKAKVPTKAYEGDLGWDVYSIGPYTLWHGDITMIQTGIAIQPRKGWGYLARERGSQAKNQVFAHGGTFDNGFRGEVIIGLTCEAPQFYINEGDKIAQLIFVPIATGYPQVVNELDQSERGERKWGSSGR